MEATWSSTAALGSFFTRAARDVADTVGGTMPNIPSAFSGSEDEGSQKGDGRSALEKYGPKMNTERKWRKGAARVAAHMPFTFYHNKFNPSVQDSSHESSPASPTPSKMGSAMTQLLEDDAKVAGTEHLLHKDIKWVSAKRGSPEGGRVKEIERRDSIEIDRGEAPRERGYSAVSEDGESAEC